MSKADVQKMLSAKGTATTSSRRSAVSAPAPVAVPTASSAWANFMDEDCGDVDADLSATTITSTAKYIHPTT